MKTSVLDDYTTIAQRRALIIGNDRGECAIRAGRPSGSCWCYMAGPNNSSLPCPPQQVTVNEGESNVMGFLVPTPWMKMARQHKGVIAGGCLRDLIMNRLPAKDVDIFVSGLTEADCGGNGRLYMEGFHVTDVVEDGVTYQIIKHRFDGDLLDRFDLGLCRVAYCPQAGWQFTPEFVKDVANRSITVLRTEYFNHEKHLASVQSRYPDFTLVPYRGDEIVF